jgi:hypothetical protein
MPKGVVAEQLREQPKLASWKIGLVRKKFSASLNCQHHLKNG